MYLNWVFERKAWIQKCKESQSKITEVSNHLNSYKLNSAKCNKTFVDNHIDRWTDIIVYVNQAPYESLLQISATKKAQLSKYDTTCIEKGTFIWFRWSYHLNTYKTPTWKPHETKVDSTFHWQHTGVEGSKIGSGRGDAKSFRTANLVHG